MASTTNAVPAANGASGNTLNNTNVQNNAGGRASPKSSSGLKGSDGGRKQSGSPVDGAQRRNTSQKAWTQGTNPITQRSSSYNQQNGNMSQQKALTSPKPMAPKETNILDKNAHDRMTFLLASCIGLNATVTIKSGEKFAGIVSTSTLESNQSSVMLKMVQRTFSGNEGQMNGAVDRGSAFLGASPDHNKVFDFKEVVDVAVKNVTTVEAPNKGQNGVNAGFRTDSDISGNLSMRERNLQRWEPTTETDVDLSLENAGNTGWDQFETNARLFGATSNYDENIYTTLIDRSAPSYKRKQAEADRIAREIEGTTVTNAHMREERGLAHENDGVMDEEEKYSGVRRDDANFPPLSSGQANKYTPPARRAPTGQPTVSGAPVDPAIISAQMARPDAATKSIQVKNQVTPMQSNLPDAQTTGKSAPVAPSSSTNANPTTQPSKTALSSKLAVDAEQKSSSSRPPSIHTSVSPQRKVGGVENATANVEIELLDSFKQFASNERMRTQERRRNLVTQDRTMKLNELLKFSKNFKLGTEVPKDLVPILAKDPVKQKEIIEKAQRQHDDVSSSPPSKAPSSAESKSAPRPLVAGRYDVSTAPPAAPSDKQNFPRGRPGHPPSGPQVSQGGRSTQSQTIHPGRGGTGLLSHRLADIQQQRKAGVPVAVPTPLPIHDRGPPNGPMMDHSDVSSPQKPSAVHTPTSSVSTKFNVKALEFKPNPAANTFTPADTSNMSSSPHSNIRTRSVSRAPSPTTFFGIKKRCPASERPSINDAFNPIKRMKKECETQKTTKDYSFNGGIPPAYKTPPTWDVAKENEDKTYADMFDKTVVRAPSASPQNRSTSNPQLTHQHQLPFHLQQGVQNVPQLHTPHQSSHHLHPQQHHHAGVPHHFDEHHRMHMSTSSPQVYPSPRLQQSHMAYPSPMGPQAQLAYGQPMPQFFPGQGGPQQVHMRHYAGGPQFINPQGAQMGAPMMVHQPSGGPHMGIPQGMATPFNPQMQMYSPNPGYVYPQHVGPPQPHSGYPSPSRGAPMMIHQGSQQGQHPQPVMFMNPGQHGQPVYSSQQPGHMPPMRAGYPQQQPHFSSSPHQAHHFPPQPYRMPSNSYGQMQQMNMPPQPPPQMAGPGPHGPEGIEEVK